MVFGSRWEALSRIRERRERLAFELPQLLLLPEQVETRRGVRLRLAGTMRQSSKLTVYELIPQP